MTQPILHNRAGYCVTEDGLDRFWPRDDREADTTSEAFKLFNGGKGGMAIPTCDTDELTYEEESIQQGISQAEFYKFMFDGQVHDPSLHQVPVGASLPYLLAGVLAVWIAKWRKG